MKKDKYLKVSLNGQEGRFISSYERVEPTLEDADISHKLMSGLLNPSEKKRLRVMKVVIYFS